MRLLMAFVTLLFPICELSASSPMVYAEKKSLYSKAHDSSREYFVHLPESYQSNKQKKYPVLYVLHGQTSTLGAVASIEAISDDLPELIVVGVQSGGIETLPVLLKDGETNSKGQAFRSFLLNELVPHIQQSYRTADFSILLGHSGSGRFVLNSLLDDPGQFNAYFASSPSIDDNLINNRVKQEKPKLADNNTRLIITLANEGDHMQKPFRELVSLFSQSDRSNSFFHHKEYPEQSHGSTYLVSQLFSLRTLFEGWRPSWKIKKMGLSSVQKHYQQLSARFGFEVELPSIDLWQMVFVFSRAESEEYDRKTEEVIDYWLNRDPGIVDEFFDIVDALNNYGFIQPGKDLHQLVCRKLDEHKKCNEITNNYVRPKIKALPISTKEQKRIVGRYRFDTDRSFTIFAENERIFMKDIDDKLMEIFRIGDNQYVRKEIRKKFRFEKLKGDNSVSLVFGINGETEHVRKRLAKDKMLSVE